MASWRKYRKQIKKTKGIVLIISYIVSQITSTVTNIAGLAEQGSVKTPGDTAKDGQYFSELILKDYEWALASGSATENQIFYMTTKAGGFMFVQLIYSGIG